MFHRQRALTVVGVFVALLVVGSLAPAGQPALVARDGLKHLLLDSRVVAGVEGLELVPGKVEKDSHNPLFQADKPWENALNNLYPNVTYDAEERRLKLWYKCVLADKEAIAKTVPPSTIHDVGWLLLYATSEDGVKWEKPELGLHAFDGSTRNNITARDTAGGAGVFKDPHDPDPARRYKMVYDLGFNKLRVRFSPDGLHWTGPIEPKGLALPEGQGTTGDTHNNAFWDERLGKYVLITRVFRGERLVGRSESADFLNWLEPAVVLRSSQLEGKTHQTYCMPSFPYANVYLGFVMMYHPGTDRTVDCELAWSPDSVHWQRVCPGKPLIPRGPDGSYDSKCIYGPAGPAIVQDGKLLIYYGGDDFPHRGWKRHCLPCLARLRVDGFAGYRPVSPAGRGTIVTRPMLATGHPLGVSADAQGGSLRIAVLDAEGFSMNDCLPVIENITDGEVRWKGGRDFAELKGKTVRLKFELTNATLYALRGLELRPAQ